jgi:hypothetical protein
MNQTQQQIVTMREQQKRRIDRRSKQVRLASLILLGGILLALSIKESFKDRANEDADAVFEAKIGLANKLAKSREKAQAEYADIQDREDSSRFKYQFMHDRHHHHKQQKHGSSSSATNDFDDDDDDDDVLEIRKLLKRALTKRPAKFELALGEYVKRHKVATATNKKQSEEYKYIVYVSGGNDGYGNRLPGVAMAFLWALLTDRILLIHWRDTFPNPASWGKLFQPPDGIEFDVDKLRDSLSDKILQFVPIGSSASCNNAGNGGKKSQASSGSGLACALVVREDYQKIAQKDLNKQYPEKVLLFKSDDYAMPLLVNNEHYKEDVKALFNNREANVFGHIARWLLTPSAKVQQTVDRTMESLGKYNFGMHLRMQKPMPAGGDKGVKVPDPEVFFRFARMRAEALGFPASETIFYLASDDARARERATLYFRKYDLTVRFMDGIKFGNDGDRTSVESLQNAIAEMRVLSMCDEIIGSYGSSFSAVAASWGAITKYDIRADGSYWNTAWNEPCWRFASRGHNSAISDAASLPYHEGCHEGQSTFKDWQKSNWNKEKSS